MNVIDRLREHIEGLAAQHEIIITMLSENASENARPTRLKSSLLPR
jgi:hypothetical protein